MDNKKRGKYTEPQPGPQRTTIRNRTFAPSLHLSEISKYTTAHFFTCPISGQTEAFTPPKHHTTGKLPLQPHTTESKLAHTTSPYWEQGSQHKRMQRDFCAPHITSKKSKMFSTAQAICRSDKDLVIKVSCQRHHHPSSAHGQHGHLQAHIQKASNECWEFSKHMPCLHQHLLTHSTPKTLLIPFTAPMVVSDHHTLQILHWNKRCTNNFSLP